MAPTQKNNTKTNPPQHLAQAAWRLVKEFAGIYNNPFNYQEFAQCELSVLLRQGIGGQIDYAIHTLKEGTHPVFLFHQDSASPGVLKPVKRHYLTEMSYAYFKLMHPEYVSGATPKRVPYGWNGKKVCSVNTKINLRDFDSIARDSVIDWETEKTKWWKPSHIDNCIDGSLRLPPIKWTSAQTDPGLWLYLEQTIEEHSVQNSAAAIPIAKASVLKTLARHPLRNSVYKKLDKVLNNKTRACLCGAVISTRRKSDLDRHLKTHSHCVRIFRNANLSTINNWWDTTGNVPVGFTRDLSVRARPPLDVWRHVIPEDRKRPVKHYAYRCIQHMRAHGQPHLDPCMSFTLHSSLRRSTDGRGYV